MREVRHGGFPAGPRGCGLGVEAGFSLASGLPLLAVPSQMPLGTTGINVFARSRLPRSVVGGLVWVPLGEPPEPMRAAFRVVSRGLAGWAVYLRP
jgi:hypothetical protein